MFIYLSMCKGQQPDVNSLPVSDHAREQVHGARVPHAPARARHRPEVLQRAARRDRRPGEYHLPVSYHLL